MRKPCSAEGPDGMEMTVFRRRVNFACSDAGKMNGRREHSQKKWKNGSVGKSAGNVFPIHCG